MIEISRVDPENTQLRENIEWLIDQYQTEIDTLEEDRKENHIVGNAYITGKLGVYGRVVKDLQALLEGEDE